MFLRQSGLPSRADIVAALDQERTFPRASVELGRRNLLTAQARE
jgi:hypothetical protein